MTAGQTNYRWYHKLSGLLYVIFCFEMGIFLTVLPWLDIWDTNYFAWIAPESGWWRGFWMSPYVRGAVSGIGLVNIYIALVEVFRLRRFSGGDELVSLE
jgi:hypothetical protein